VRRYGDTCAASTAEFTASPGHITSPGPHIVYGPRTLLGHSPLAPCRDIRAPFRLAIASTRVLRLSLPGARLLLRAIFLSPYISPPPHLCVSLVAQRNLVRRYHLESATSPHELLLLLVMHSFFTGPSITSESWTDDRL
jgi:hypothetical protein